MQALHFIAPSHFTTSSELIGLMQMVMLHIGGEHRAVVLGQDSDAKYMRSLGISLHGYIDGVENISGTLQARIDNMIQASETERQLIFAWGWQSAVVLSRIKSQNPIIAYVDAIDTNKSLTEKSMTVITPSMLTTNLLLAQDYSKIHVAEPLIGLKPISLVPDRNAVKDHLEVDRSRIVSILGEAASPDSIVSMAFRLNSINADIALVLPESYQFRTDVIKRAESFQVSDLIRDLPTSLRSVDVLATADAAWVPDSPEYAQTSGVLGTLSAAWEGVPLAVSNTHAAAEIPIIGKRIAWAQDELEVGGWLLKLIQEPDYALQETLELAHRVRAIASPARFVEGLQLRIPSAVRFRI